MDANNRDSILLKCRDIALECFGTGYIFEQRANKLRGQIRFLTFLGIVIPILIGAIVLNLGKTAVSQPILYIAGIFGIIQIIGSTWSLTSGWDDAYSYSIESMNSNHRLSRNYLRLADSPPSEQSELQMQFDLLNQEDQFRSAEDYKQGVSEKEKRMGMCAGLRIFKRSCAGCGMTPTSMKASSCSVCGQF